MSTHLTDNEIWTLITSATNEDKYAVLQVHLDQCSACTERLQLIQLLNEDLTSMELEKCPDELTQVVLSKILRERKYDQSVAFWMPWTKRIIIASLILTTLLILFSINSLKPQGRGIPDVFHQSAVVLIIGSLLTWFFYLNDRLLNRLTTHSE